MSAQPGKRHATSQPRQVVSYRSGPPDDEISLIDIWLVLYRRRWLVTAIIAVVVAGGLAYAFLIPPRYAYTTTIEIGTRIVNNLLVPIESQESVRAKIIESYVPYVIQQYQSKEANIIGGYGITVSAPKDSQIVVLSSKGVVQDETVYKQLHSMVVERIRDDHNRVSSVLRKGIEAQVAERERKVSALQEQKRLLDAQFKRIDEERVLLSGEIEQINTLADESERQRAKAVMEISDSAKAMTLLMLSEQVRQTYSRLADLKKRMMIDLPNKRDEFEKAFYDNLLAQADQRAEAEQMRLSLANMLDTRTVAPSLRLPDPVGPGKAVVVVLSLVVGLLLAVVLAFFIEFLSKVKLVA